MGESIAGVTMRFHLMVLFVLVSAVGPADDKLGLETWWARVEAVALLAAHIATLLPRVVREDAFAFAMFRDAGIPLLMKRWPD